MQIIDEYWDEANWDEQSFYNHFNGDGFFECIDENLNYRSNDEIIQVIRNRVENENNLMITELNGLRDGRYRRSNDRHFVVIIDYKEGKFLISDSDAPYENDIEENLQGQFIWVSEEIIGSSFLGGYFI
jgi:hypothetical protein